MILLNCLVNWYGWTYWLWWLNVYVPLVLPLIHVPSCITPHVMVIEAFEKEVFRFMWDSEGWIHQDGINVFVGRGRDARVSLSTSWGYRRRCLSAPWLWTSGLHNCEKYLLFKPLSLQYFVTAARMVWDSVLCFILRHEILMLKRLTFT